MQKMSTRTLFLVLGICIFCIGNIRANKWVTDKDSIVVDAIYADDEEGELHFDGLDDTEKSECMTVDLEPGVCITLRRCHPILFGENGELRHASLAEEFSQNVDTCGKQNVVDDEPVAEPVPDQNDEDVVRSIPADIGKASAAIADRIVCCAKDKLPHAARSNDGNEDERGMYQTTLPPPVIVPFGNEGVEQVTQFEEVVVDVVPFSPETVVEVESTDKPVVAFQQESQVGEEVSATDKPIPPSFSFPAASSSVTPSISTTTSVSSSSTPTASSFSTTTSVPSSSTTSAPSSTTVSESPVPEEPQAEPEAEPAPEQASVGQELIEPSDFRESCPAVTAYNTWPSFENYPFLAAIQTRSNTGPLCSGSLIDSRHILTAAHCLHRFNSKDVARMQVRIGFTKNPVNDTFNDYHQERKATKIIFHKRFHEQSKMDNNIALVQLDQPVEFDEHVAPIGIFNDLRGFDVGSCSGVEAGWIKYGNRKVTGISGGVIHYVEPPMSDFVLREAISRIYKNSDCQLQLFTEITEDMLCAKTDAFEAHGVSTDHFRGNDGGPLVIKVGDRVQQVGIKSWAYEGNQYPTVFTRVDRYLSWIKDNLQL